MRITKFAHACVRIEYDGHVVVIDPGMFTDAAAVDGATAILITHEHPDHWTPELLRATDAPVHTIAAVAASIGADAPDVEERVTVHAPGDVLDVGFPVELVGEKHAVIYDQLPHFDNSGYLCTLGDTTLFHPGDALTVPDRPVDVLCLPVSAPWMKIAECLDYARAVAAPRNLAIHDEIYSEAGLGIVDGHVRRFLPERSAYARLTPGADLA